MRIVFIGASTLGLRCLQKIIGLPGCEVVGAVTAPRQFPISYRPQGVTNVLFADVKSYCGTQGIDCTVMKQGMKDPALMEHVRAFSPDIFIVAGWYHMVPKAWRDMAPAYGLHSSLLPDYSGGAPLVWAMINGEKKTGISLFQLADGVDNGPIVGQLATDIQPEDTIATLSRRIELLGIALLSEHLPRLADGSARLTTQDESRRRIVPQRGPEDGMIDWLWPAARVHNFIRAQTRPYPGAFSFHGKNKVTIWSARLSDGTESDPPPPAKIEGCDGRVLVGCGDGTALEIADIAIDGTDLTAQSWWRERGESSATNDFARDS